MPFPREVLVMADDEVTVVLLPLPPTALAPTRLSTPPAPTLGLSLVAELRHLSPLTQAGPSRFDGAPHDDENYIEMGAKVKLTISTFSNKRLAEQLVDMILLPRDQEEWRSQPVEEIFTNFIF